MKMQAEHLSQPVIMIAEVNWKKEAAPLETAS
jgi:hypothetical protein